MSVATRRRLAAALGVLTLTAAACGGDDGDPAARSTTANATDATTPSTAPATDTATSGPPTATGSAPASTGPILTAPEAEPAAGLTLGRADAPVVMVEYSDFQCPFCRRFAVETEPELISRFVDAGVLRIEWRDFPYLGNESLWAAQAARAAANQGHFWEFQRQLFDEQGTPNSGHVTAEFLEGIALDLGLDLVQFREDMDAAATFSAIEADFRSGVEAGVNGTPAFFINGRPVIGAQPTEVFVQVIEEAAGTGVPVTT